MITVVHCKKAPYDVYIGRTSSTPNHFGNPFTHKPLNNTLAVLVTLTREQAIDNYRKWLLGTDFKNLEPERKQWILDNLHTLKNKTLGCWCKPLPCHGDVLKGLVDK